MTTNTVTDPAGGRVAATASTQSKQSWSASALDDSRRRALRTRPVTAPAYYLGRPAWMWLAVFSRTKSHSRCARSKDGPTEEHP